MKRLTAADSWYLYAETPSMHMHVVGAVILDATDSPIHVDPDVIEEHALRIVPNIEGFSDRLLSVPLGIDHPVWASDDEFSIGRHVFRHTIDAPGGNEELCDFIGEVASSELDRSKPLWEMHIVDGLMGGRLALVTKMHHSIMDGETGVDMMPYLLSMEPGGDPLPVPQESAGEAPLGHDPGPIRLAVDAAWNRVSNPKRPLNALRRTVEGVSKAAVTVVGRRRSGHSTPGPFTAPRTPWNASLTPARSVAFSSVSLEDLKETKRALGVTVNDVVLGACTLGLRRILMRQGDDLDRPLVAAIPVSVHGAGMSEASESATNQVSNLFAHLPVQLSDPQEIIDYIHGVTGGAKELNEDLGADILGDMVDLVPPSLLHFAMDAMSWARVPDYTPPIYTTIISNVPGSPVPLYLAGAEVVDMVPFGPLIEGCGLNITAISHMDRFHLGIIACPDLIPDVEGILEEIVEGFEEMHKLVQNRS